MQAEDITIRLQEKVLKEAFRNKWQKTIDFFLCVKTQWNEALNIELMDKNSQYTFMCVK
jgi:hypothetical protein